MGSKMTYRGNIFHGEIPPLREPGLFAKGDTRTINRGDVIELFTNSEWTALSSDAAMNSDIAVADEDIKAGDRAGYYPIIIPRPGDYFEYELETAGNPLFGASLYYSAAQKVKESGSNILCRMYKHSGYPPYQGHLSVGAIGDAGTTIVNVSFVWVIFNHDNSYYSLVDDLAITG